MSRALLGIKFSTIWEPFKVLILNMPGLNFVRNMFLLIYLPIEVSGVIFFLFTFKHFSLTILFGFPRYNILKFAENSSKKYIYSSIRNDLRLIFVPALILLLIYFFFIDIVLPESLMISSNVLQMIFLWVLFDLIKVYICSFLLTFKKYLIVSFFTGNCFSIISILLVYFSSAMSTEKVLSVFIFASLIELLIILTSFYSKKLPRQEEDSQKSIQKIKHGMKNFLFDSSEVAFYSLPVFVISALADENLFYIFNSAVIFFMSAGVISAVTRRYFFPKFAKSFSKKDFLNSLFFLMTVCVIGSILFFFLLDIILNIKPLLKEYKILIFYFFLSGLFISFSFFSRTIYSLKVNISRITRINLFYLFKFICTILIINAFNILNLINISSFYLISSGAYCFYTTFLTLRAVQLNEK